MCAKYSSDGLYSCGEITNLGEYTNVATIQSMEQQHKKREDILNTLVGKSIFKSMFDKNKIKICSELITVDKKKGVKIKSED
jgi:hypothetical protein